MDVRHLELLRELSARGTLTAVAEATYRTPSAVSQQLKSAEREFGVRLVEPYSRGVRLTAAGQLLADSAGEVAQLLASVQAKLDAAMGEPHGVVSIGTLPSAGEVLLPGLFARLAGSAIQLRLDDFDLAEVDYAARALDVDIVIAHSLTGDTPAGAQDLVAHVLAREPIDVGVPEGHPLSARARLRPKDLVGTTWIAVPQGYPFDSILIAIENLTGARLERTLRIRDNRLIESLVAQGVGMALLPRFSTRPRPGVRLRPLVGVRAERSIVALSRPDRHERQAVRMVIEHLVEIGSSVQQRHRD